MTEAKRKLTFDVAATRVDAHGSIATCKAATIPLDTDLAANADAFNPAELLLAALVDPRRRPSLPVEMQTSTQLASTLPA